MSGRSGEKPARPPPAQGAQDTTGRRPRAKPFALPPEGGGANGPAGHRPASGRTQGRRRQQAGSRNAKEGGRERGTEGGRRVERTSPTTRGDWREQRGEAETRARRPQMRGETREHALEARAPSTDRRCGDKGPTPEMEGRRVLHRRTGCPPT